MDQSNSVGSVREVGKIFILDEQMGEKEIMMIIIISITKRSQGKHSKQEAFMRCTVEELIYRDNSLIKLRDMLAGERLVSCRYT